MRGAGGRYAERAGPWRCAATPARAGEAGRGRGALRMEHKYVATLPNGGCMDPIRKDVVLHGWPKPGRNVVIENIFVPDFDDAILDTRVHAVFLQVLGLVFVRLLDAYSAVYCTAMYSNCKFTRTVPLVPQYRGGRDIVLPCASGPKTALYRTRHYKIVRFTAFLQPLPCTTAQKDRSQDAVTHTLHLH